MQLITPNHAHSLRQATPSNVLAIFPAAGTLSVNVNQTTNTGKLAKDVLTIFSQFKFNQSLQLDNNENELFFGLFAYQVPQDLPHHGAPSIHATSKKDSDNLIFMYGPLPDDVKKNSSVKAHGKKYVQ